MDFLCGRQCSLPTLGRPSSISLDKTAIAKGRFIVFVNCEYGDGMFLSGIVGGMPGKRYGQVARPRRMWPPLHCHDPVPQARKLEPAFLVSVSGRCQLRIVRRNPLSSRDEARDMQKE